MTAPGRNAPGLDSAGKATATPVVREKAIWMFSQRKYRSVLFFRHIVYAFDIVSWGRTRLNSFIASKIFPHYGGSGDIPYFGKLELARHGVTLRSGAIVVNGHLRLNLYRIRNSTASPHATLRLHEGEVVGGALSHRVAMVR